MFDVKVTVAAVLDRARAWVRAQRTGLIVGAALMLLATCALAASPVDGVGTRFTPYDWACMNEAGAVLSNRQSPVLATLDCEARARVDGKAYFVQGGRYRISVPAAAPPAPVNCVVSAWSAWSYTAWTASGNTETRTGTRTRTVTTPAASGGTACPNLSESTVEARAYVPTPPVGTGTASLSWTAPTQFTDGTSIPAGSLLYRIYQGTSPSMLLRVAETAGLSFAVEQLPRGTHYFAVTAVAGAVEGGKSTVGSKVIP